MDAEGGTPAPAPDSNGAVPPPPPEPFAVIPRVLPDAAGTLRQVVAVASVVTLDNGTCVLLASDVPRLMTAQALYSGLELLRDLATQEAVRAALHEVLGGVDQAATRVFQRLPPPPGRRRRGG